MLRRLRKNVLPSLDVLFTPLPGRAEIQEQYEAGEDVAYVLPREHLQPTLELLVYPRADVLALVAEVQRLRTALDDQP